MPGTRSQHPTIKPIPSASDSSSPAQPLSMTAHAESSTPSFSSSASTSQNTSQSLPTQSTFSSSFNQLYAQLQHDLTHDPFWMGNSAYRNHVEWARVNEANDIVIEKCDPSVITNLTCIAEVSSVKYWMYPGGYCTAANVDGDEGTNNFKPVPFYRSRGSARPVQPCKPRLNEWWIDTVKNLAALRRDGSKKTMKMDIFDDNYSHMVRIRHDWFRPKDILEGDDMDCKEELPQLVNNGHSLSVTVTSHAYTLPSPTDKPSRMPTPPASPHTDKGKGKEVSTHSENPDNAPKDEDDMSKTHDDYRNPFDDPQFHLSTWTFCSQSDWATTNINKIIDDDQLEGVPLPAFDLRRNGPIHPNDCENMLKGALVKVTFNLARQMIGKASINIYLDVVKITRLLPPGYEDKLTSTVAKRRGPQQGQGPAKKACLPHF